MPEHCSKTPWLVVLRRRMVSTMFCRPLDDKMCLYTLQKLEGARSPESSLEYLYGGVHLPKRKLRLSKVQKGSQRRDVHVLHVDLRCLQRRLSSWRLCGGCRETVVADREIKL